MTALLIQDRLAPSVASPPPSDDTLVKLWLHGRGIHTRRAYEADVAKLRTFTPLPLATITLDQLQRFSDSLTGADASKARTIGSIKSLFTFSHRLGYLPFDTARALRSPRRHNGVRPERILTVDQVLAMIDNEPNLRNRTLLKVLYASGMRVAELTTFRWRDCINREDGGQITVTGKGGKVRSIPIPATVWSELVRFRGLAEKIVYDLDPSTVWNIVRKAAERVGITVGVSTHWIRHATGSHTIQAGGPLSLVQQQLGHASLTTTGMYLHAMPGESCGQYLRI